MSRCANSEKTGIVNLNPTHKQLRVELAAASNVTSDYTSFTLVNFDTVVSNTFCNELLLNNSVVTIKTSANYGITAALLWQDNAANTRQVVVQILNPSNVVEYFFSTSTNVFGFEDQSVASATLFIPAGWKIKVVARQVSGVAIDVLKSPSSFLQITRSE